MSISIRSGNSNRRWKLRKGGKLHQHQHGEQQADITLADGQGNFDPNPSNKKHRFNSFSEAVAAASTALSSKDRTKNRFQEAGASTSLCNESDTPWLETQSSEAPDNRARSDSISSVPHQDKPEFSVGAGYTWDASRGVAVHESNRNQTQNTRNFNSFGSIAVQPDSSLFAKNETTKIRDSSNPKNKDVLIVSNDMELKSIENSVLRAKLDFPELKGPKHESTDDAVIRFIQQYERLSAPLRDSKGRLDGADRMRKDLYRAEDELQEVKGRLSICNREYKDLKTRHLQETDQLKQTIDRLRFENNEQVSSHGAKLRKEQNILQREKEQLKQMFESQLRKMRDDSASQIKVINDLKAQIIQERTQWNAAMKRLEGDKDVLESRLRSVQYEYDSRLRDAEEKSEKRFLRERDKYDEKIKLLESEIAQLRSKAEEELLSQKEQLTKEHEEESFQLRNVIEDFKVASIKREHFKGLTDRDVAGHFLRLANDIEDFSRLEWDFRKELDWPFTEDRLRHFNPKNTRKLKQQIVQNTLWVIFYNNIFRSPFRVFGIEGKAIDADWVEIYAPDSSPYEWPTVAAELERSRYENAKAFLAAIEPAAGRSRLKDGYEESLMTITDTICRALQKITTVEARMRKILEGILRLFTQVWMEMCAQRYRLVVTVSGGSGDLLTSMGADSGTIRLILRPDLKRYGDSQGKDLTVGEPVAGWKSQVQSYPSQ